LDANPQAYSPLSRANAPSVREYRKSKAHDIWQDRAIQHQIDALNSLLLENGPATLSMMGLESGPRIYKGQLQ
jgi:hypothetical protein